MVYFKYDIACLGITHHKNPFLTGKVGEPSHWGVLVINLLMEEVRMGRGVGSWKQVSVRDGSSDIAQQSSKF